MNCNTAVVNDWLNNRLTQAERTAFETHLAGCISCRDELNMAKAVAGIWEQIDVPEPSAAMEQRFQAMLVDYKQTLPKKGFNWRPFWIDLYDKLTTRPSFQFAYSLLVLLAGIGVAYLFFDKRPGHQQQAEMAELSSEVQEMKQVMLLTLLENTSATERLKAVGYTDEIYTADKQVIEALLTTLDDDPNVNVRLAALEALAKYSDDPVVRSGLVRSIVRQPSPLVQSALADLMMKLREKKSIEPFRKLLQNNQLINPLRTKIQQTITHLDA